MRSTCGDKFLLLALVLLLAVSYWLLWADSVQGAAVVVKYQNQTLATLPLNKNQRFQASGHLGINEIEVQHGQVRFHSSPCANQVCVNHGWLSHSGEVAACLPNRISLQITGQATQGDAALDAINH